MKTQTQHGHQPAWLALLCLSLIAPRLLRVVAGIHVPDPTLAVFFLAGLSGARGRWLALGLLAVAGLDLTRISLGSGLDCITPGYPLRYAGFVSLWAAGRWSIDRGLAPAAGGLLAATSLAFLLTSGVFYLLSDTAGEPTLAGALAYAAQRLPERVATTLGYTLALLQVARWLWRSPTTAGQRPVAG